jgi:ribosome-binding factor A
MFADVYVNALGDEDRHKDVMRGLERAQGFLRREVGKRLALRHAPELHFHWDATLERSEHINRLIASLDIPPDDAPAPQTAPDDQPDELA